MSEQTAIADKITAGFTDAGMEDSPLVLPSETAPATEPKTPEAPAPVAAETTAPPAVTQPAQPDPKPDTHGVVPISALLDEREKRQSERKLREAAEKRVADYEASQRSQVPIPDAINQPEEFQAYLTGLADQTRLHATMTISHRFASQLHGEDKIQEAAKWGMEQGEPFVKWFRSQHDPFGWLMQQYQRHELAEKIGTDPDAWARQRVAELAAQANGAAPLATGQATPPVPSQPASQTQPAVPRSLASASSAGGHAVVPVDENAAFKEVFGTERARRGSG